MSQTKIYNFCQVPVQTRRVSQKVAGHNHNTRLTKMCNVSELTQPKSLFTKARSKKTVTVYLPEIWFIPLISTVPIIKFQSEKQFHSLKSQYTFPPLNIIVLINAVVDPPLLSLPLSSVSLSPLSFFSFSVCVCLRGCVHLGGCSSAGSRDWCRSGSGLISHTGWQFVISSYLPLIFYLQ